MIAVEAEVRELEHDDLAMALHHEFCHVVQGALNRRTFDGTVEEVKIVIRAQIEVPLPAGELLVQVLIWARASAPEPPPVSTYMPASCEAGKTIWCSDLP